MKINPVQQNKQKSFGRLANVIVDESVAKMGTRVADLVSDSVYFINKIDAPNVRAKISAHRPIKSYGNGELHPSNSGKVVVIVEEIEKYMKKRLFGFMEPVEKTRVLRSASIGGVPSSRSAVVKMVKSAIANMSAN